MKVSGVGDTATRGDARLRRAAKVGAALVAVLGLILWGWSTVSSRRQVAEATRALDSGRLDMAEALIDRIRRARPESADGPFLAARLAWANRKPEEVLTLLAQARERGYPEPPMERMRGLLYAASNRKAEAEPLLRRAWEASAANDPEVADALCRIDFEAYRFARVKAVADDWARRAPEDLRPLLWVAEIHTRDNAGPEAQIRAFDAILARDPGQHRSRLNRASALQRMGRLEDAKTDYDLYLKAAPDDAEGHIGAARAAEGLDDEDAALGHFRRVLQIQPDHVAGLIGVASILIRRGDPAGAIPLLDRAMAREPNDPEPRYRKGQALQRLGRPDEARAEFAARIRLQKEQEEIDRIHRDLVRDPTVPLMADAAAWLLGHGYDALGVEWAEKALAKQPRHPATARLLADHYARKGDPGRARYYRLMIPGEARTP